MQQKLINLIADILDVSPETLTLESSQDTVPEWDSLKHLNLVVEIESEFEIEIDPEEIGEMYSIKAILDLIQGKQ
jgi:acyl carrier protein